MFCCFAKQSQCEPNKKNKKNERKNQIIKKKLINTKSDGAKLKKKKKQKIGNRAKNSIKEKQKKIG